MGVHVKIYWRLSDSQDVIMISLRMTYGTALHTLFGLAMTLTELSSPHKLHLAQLEVGMRTPFFKFDLPMQIIQHSEADVVVAAAAAPAKLDCIRTLSLAGTACNNTR